MSTEIYAGGTAQIISGGSKNPAVAAMFAAIMSQDSQLQVSHKNFDGELQNIGSIVRGSGITLG